MRPKKALATRSRFWLLILSEGCTFECLAGSAHPFGSVVRGHDDGRQSRRCCWQRWWDRSAGRVASAIRPRLVEQPAFAIRFVGGCCCGRRRWGINSFLRPPRWCVRRFRSSCRDNLESTKALSKYQPPFHNAPSPFRQDASERSGIERFHSLRVERVEKQRLATTNAQPPSDIVPRHVHDETGRRVVRTEGQPRAIERAQPVNCKQWLSFMGYKAGPSGRNRAH